MCMSCSGALMLDRRNCRRCGKITRLESRLFRRKLFSNPNSKIFRRSYLIKPTSFGENTAVNYHSAASCRSSEPLRRLWQDGACPIGILPPITSSARCWCCSYLYAGYFFGTIPLIQGQPAADCDYRSFRILPRHRLSGIARCVARTPQNRK